MSCKDIIVRYSGLLCSKLFFIFKLYFKFILQILLNVAFRILVLSNQPLIFSPLTPCPNTHLNFQYAAFPLFPSFMPNVF